MTRTVQLTKQDVVNAYAELFFFERETREHVVSHDEYRDDPERPWWY